MDIAGGVNSSLRKRKNVKKSFNFLFIANDFHRSKMFTKVGFRYAYFTSFPVCNRLENVYNVLVKELFLQTVNVRL